MSICPKCSLMVLMAPSTSAARVRSAGTTSVSPPNSAFSASSFSVERATRASFAPSAASARAAARPMPELAPVTTATRPEMDCANLSSCGNDSADGEAAIDDEIGAVDHGRGIAGQEHRGQGDLLGLRKAARGNFGAGALALLAGPADLGQFGFYHGGRDAVGGDAARTPFERQAIGHAQKTCLAGAIGHVLVDTDHGGLRGNRDDTAPAGLQHGR